MSDSRPSAGAELAPPPPRWRTGTLGRLIALAMALTLLLLTLQLGRVRGSGARTVAEVQVRLPTDRSADRSPAQALQRAADFVSGDGQPSREAAPAPGVTSAPAGARAQTQRGARSADGGKPPLSYEDVAAQFANASFIRAEAAAFDLRCRGYRAQWKKLLVTPAIARLERVLVVDLNLFRLGHAHGRATFLRMDPCSAPLPPHLGLLALRPDSPACKFDLGQFFLNLIAAVLVAVAVPEVAAVVVGAVVLAVAAAEAEGPASAAAAVSVHASSAARGDGHLGMKEAAAAGAASSKPARNPADPGDVPRQPSSSPLQRAWSAYDAEFA
ncbi:hypothetical protein T492DRAFT_913628 [Pavlovales sp. CCMP2436]|nr:hypothetical protein T492DRAFT_913628 [Pavlovales sp. CCMP2436]